MLGRSDGGSVLTNQTQREDGIQAGDGQGWCPKMAAADQMACEVCWDVRGNGWFLSFINSLSNARHSQIRHYTWLNFLRLTLSTVKGSYIDCGSPATAHVGCYDCHVETEYCLRCPQRASKTNKVF